jgi:acyl-[acyl carrier protein]--UDP-N-acetylglucosamine O-acyltransferase
VYDAPFDRTSFDVCDEYQINTGFVTPVAVADSDAVAPEQIAVGPFAVISEAVAREEATVTVTAFLLAGEFSQ